jgi:soluble lytic murein transglycosylase-like protein
MTPGMKRALMIYGGAVVGYLIFKRWDEPVVTPAGDEPALPGTERADRSRPPTGVGMSLPPEARQYREIVERVASDLDVDPALIFAIMYVETRYGTSGACNPKGPGCVGDNGHGHGLMQLDDRTYASFISQGTWRDPETNIRTAVEGSLKPGLRTFKYLATSSARGWRDWYQAAAAGYNAGPGRVKSAMRDGKSPDSITTGGDYGARVLAAYDRITGVA